MKYLFGITFGVLIGSVVQRVVFDFSWPAIFAAAIVTFFLYSAIVLVAKWIIK